jgi:hypothetical protein
MQSKCPDNGDDVRLTAAVKFKNACLNEKNDDNLKYVNQVVHLLFNPDRDLNTPDNSVDRLMDYLCADINFDEFKLRGMCRLNVFSF